MKGLMALVLCFCLMVLAACSGGETDEVATDTETGGGEEEVTEEEEATATIEEDETDETSEVAGGDTEEMETKEDPAPTDVAGILKKSAEVMGNIFSFEITGEFEEEYTFLGAIGYDKDTLTIKMVLRGEPMMYMITTESEFYHVGEDIYIRDFDDGIWRYLFLSSDDDEEWVFNAISTPWGEEQLDDYTSLADYYVVSDKGDHFLLSFHGDGAEFQAFATGVVIIDIDEWILDWSHPMDGWGQYEVLIDKGTYHMVGYNIEYELSDGTNYHHYKASFRHSNYDGFEEIIVPEDVKKNAVGLGF